MRLTYDEIIQKCRSYVVKVNSGEIQRAQWEHFCSFCYEDPDELEQIVQDYNEEMANRRRSETQRRNAAKKRGRPRKDADEQSSEKSSGQGSDAEPEKCSQKEYVGRVDAKRMECGAELKRLSNFIQGQLATSPYWGGSMSTKAIFLLKQNRTGRGMVEKQQVDNSGEVAITVSFGGGLEDPFG